MARKTPSYIKELKEDLILHFDAKIEQVVSREVGSLAAMTAKEFRRIDVRFEEMEKRMDGMATKEDIKDMATKEDIRDMATKSDVKEILAHIGRYEIRAQNTEDILLQDHKPRIADLEKEVFA